MTDRLNEADRQVVVFTINEQFFGIDIALVSEIIRRDTVTTVPQAPAYVEGIISLRGAVIPVINLHILFNTRTGEQNDDNRVIIVDAGGQKFGLMVNAVHEVKKITANQLRNAPAAVNAGQSYLQDIILDNDRLIVMVDPSQILSQGEMERLTAIGNPA